jgi:GNAT superfamily N-acetyltransferase
VISDAADAADVTVEEARPDDVAALLAVQRAAWLATYPSVEHGVAVDDVLLRLEGVDGERLARRVATIRDGVASDREAVYVARSGDGDVVGLAHARAWTDAPREVVALYVLPAWHGRGLGGALLRRCLTWHGDAEPVRASVVTYNRRALDLFLRYGFRPTDGPAVDRIARERGLPELPRVELVRPAGARRRTRRD